MKKNDFEWYTEKTKQQVPMVSIRKRGDFGFNNSCVEDFKLDRFEYVIPGISKDGTKVGLLFLKDGKRKGTAKLRIQGKGAALTITNFCKKYKLTRDSVRRLTPEWDEAAKIMVLNLQEN